MTPSHDGRTPTALSLYSVDAGVKAESVSALNHVFRFQLSSLVLLLPRAPSTVERYFTSLLAQNCETFSPRLFSDGYLKTIVFPPSPLPSSSLFETRFVKGTKCLWFVSRRPLLCVRPLGQFPRFPSCLCSLLPPANSYVIVTDNYGSFETIGDITLELRWKWARCRGRRAEGRGKGKGRNGDDKGGLGSERRGRRWTAKRESQGRC